MRTVFTNLELPHIWASKKQRVGKGSNLFIDGPSIYSYGYHFEIARHVEHNGQSAVLFNSQSYSPSTSKHQSYVRRAINNLTVFNVPLPRSANFNNATEDKQFWFDSYRHNFDEAIVSASRARTNKEWRLNHAKRTAEEANKFAEFFGLDDRIVIPENFDTLLADAKVSEAKRIAEKAEKTRKENAEKAKKTAENLPAWRAGLIGYLPFAHLLKHDVLRFTNEGRTIATSRGAMVPVEHAKRAYCIFKRLHDRQEEYRRNGHTEHVGHYAIDSMTADGELRIGCHSIQWAEIERLAILANWSIEDENADNGGHSENGSGTDEAEGLDAIGTGGISADSSQRIETDHS